MNVWDLNLRHLRAVAVTVQLGSLNAAARAISLSQPAVTQALHRLEDQLDIALFERRPDGMTATPAAQRLAARIERALDLIGSHRVTAAQARAFAAVARVGGYAAASAALDMTPPSLHRAISDLELALGARLTERRGRGVMITRKGRELARRLNLARVEIEAGLSEVAALQGRSSGRIVVGAMPLSRARILPAATVAFHRVHPRVEITVKEGSHAELIEPLRDGEIDFVIGARRSPSPGPDVVQTPLFVDRPVVIGRPGHPLAARRPKGARALAAYPWILPAVGAPLRDQCVRMFSEAGIAAPVIPVECGSVIMIRQILLETDSLTLLSPDQVAVELEAGWLAKIADAPSWLTREICVTTRTDWRPTQLQADLLRELEAASQALTPACSNHAQ